MIFIGILPIVPHRHGAGQSTLFPWLESVAFLLPFDNSQSSEGNQLGFPPSCCILLPLGCWMWLWLVSLPWRINNSSWKAVGWKDFEGLTLEEEANPVDGSGHTLGFQINKHHIPHLTQATLSRHISLCLQQEPDKSHSLGAWRLSVANAIFPRKGEKLTRRNQEIPGTSGESCRGGRWKKIRKRLPVKIICV